MNCPSTQLVVFTCGNPSRGDDALGPELMHRLVDSYAELANIQFIEDFQLQIEHSLDLTNRDLALFIDADVACQPPFTFTRLQPLQDHGYTTHAIHPAALLHVYQQIFKQPPPPAFLLSLRGENFELGEPLSQVANQHLQVAFEFIKPLFECLEISRWERAI